jgi:peptide/nickel transport system substrate-binding protein
MITTVRDLWRALGAMTAVMLLLASCGGGGAQAATSPTSPPRGLIGADESGSSVEPDSGGPAHGGRLVVGLESESQGFLPGESTVAMPSGLSVGHAIFDPLFLRNSNGEVEPYLAESVDVTGDSSRFTVRLRPGVWFHDGTPLDAETLKWNFDTLHMAPGRSSAGSLVAAGVIDLEVIDDRTVVYHLSAPNAAFLDLLTGDSTVGWPASRRAYETLGPDAFAEQPVGTGPFAFGEWTRDERLIVRRNRAYWRSDRDGNRLPYLDEIEFRPIPDEDSRIQSLASGAVQVVTTVRGATARRLLDLVAEREFLADVSVGDQASVTLFNTLVPPVDDVRVRRALVAASDSAEMAVVRGDDGLVPVTTQFFGPDSPWFSERAREAYPAKDGRDLELARELIESYRNDPSRSDGKPAGAPVEVEFTCAPDPTIEVSRLVQSQWGAIGVDVSLRLVDKTTLIADVVGSSDQSPPFSGDYVTACFHLVVGQEDPLHNLTATFGSVTASPANVSNFTHPEIDESLHLLRTSDDVAIRYDAMERISIVVNEHAVWVWNAATAATVGWHEDVHGLADWVLPSGNLGTGNRGGYIHLSQTYLTR